MSHSSAWIQHKLLMQEGQHKMLKMSPAQCRAARAILSITQPQLAEMAQLGLSTVVDFEKTRRKVSPEAVKAIQKALETSGIEFIEENGGGAGVRLRKPHRQGRRWRRPE
jgi:DNA-binding transcriptional regulator YiaG